MSCTPQGTSTPVLGLCKPTQGETNWAAAANSNWDLIDALLQNNIAAGSSIALSVASGVLTITNTGGGTVVNNHLTGLTLSNDVTTPNTVLDIAAGQAADSTNASYITGTAFTKTTSTFTVGSGKGGLAPALTMTSSTWYHVFASVVSSSYDVFFDTSVSAVNKPGGTTAFRRIGSFLTSPTPNLNVMSFSQNGDGFRWYQSVLDVNASNPGTNAILRSLTVPTGVIVTAFFNYTGYSTTQAISSYVSDPAAKDEQASSSLTPLETCNSSTTYINFVPLMIQTNTAGQVRTRLANSDSNTVQAIATLGWYDTRGK